MVIFCTNVFSFLWHLQVIHSLSIEQAEIPLEDSCVQFKVEVRCKRLNGSGYWSDWSSSYTSIVYNRKGKAINIVLLLLFMLYRSLNFLLISTKQQLLIAHHLSSFANHLSVKHNSITMQTSFELAGSEIDHMFFKVTILSTIVSYSSSNVWTISAWVSSQRNSFCYLQIKKNKKKQLLNWNQENWFVM